MLAKSVRIPFENGEQLNLKAGDAVELTGWMYTARDAAHMRMIETLKRGGALPFDPEGQVIYYTGPTPAKPGRVIGSVGPTTAGRMDRFTPPLLASGIKGMIGKGKRNNEVKEAIRKYGAVYMAAVGGAAALISRTVRSCEVIAYEDLGPEAICLVRVERFPAIVVNDAYGGDLYEQGENAYRM